MQTRTDKLGKVSLTIEGAWSPRRDYDKLSVVTDGPNYINYVSRIPVPKGTPLTNEKYWIKFSSLAEQIVLDYNAFTSRYGQKLEDIKKDIGDLNKLKTKDKSSTVAAINESLTNKINVVNIADYIASGNVMPGNADIYIMKDNKVNYLPHYNIIRGEDGTTLELVFCIVHSDGKGMYYTVFKQYNDTNNWIIKDQYSKEEVPEYILRHLGELNQTNEVNILDYIYTDEEGNGALMPTNVNYYIDWGPILTHMLGVDISARVPFHQGWYSKTRKEGDAHIIIDMHLVICFPYILNPEHINGYGSFFLTFILINRDDISYWQFDKSYFNSKYSSGGDDIPSWVLEAVGENVAYELPKVKAITNLVKDKCVDETKTYTSTPVERMDDTYYHSEWYKLSALSKVKIFRSGYNVQYILIKKDDTTRLVELDDITLGNFEYNPTDNVEMALQFAGNKGSATVTITSPKLQINGALNLADYVNLDDFSPKGSFTPVSSYCWTEEGLTTPVHCRIVQRGQNIYLVCCISHYPPVGIIGYLVFILDSDTYTFSLYSFYNDFAFQTPSWVYEAFDEGRVNVIDRVWKGINVLPPVTNGYYAAIDGMHVDLEYKVIYYVKDNVNRQQLVFHFKSSIIGSGYDILVYDDNFSNDCWSLNSHYSFDSAPECYRKLFYNNEDVENFVVGSTLFSSAIVETQTELINEYTVKQTNILMLDNNYSVVKRTDEEGNEINVLRIK